MKSSVDIISILGILLSLLAIIGGQYLEGGHIGSLLQVTAFFIVLGGTFGACMLQFSLPVFLQGIKMLRWVVLPPRIHYEDIIEQIIGWGQTARRGGLLSLEPILSEMDDPFMRKGLQLLVDGAEPEKLREAMEVDMYAYDEHYRMAAKVWESAGGYAPTIGILGAVMGLIHVMENLSDPSKLGGGIAVAFVATIYGVGSANLFFLPIANKLKAIIGKEMVKREMVVEGLVAIANGENPRLIETKLRGYLTKAKPSPVMARRQKHEEHENHERWLVSYADFITLLFAFFVVMYAISSINEGKYRVMSDSIQDAFKNAPTSDKVIYVPAPAPQGAETGKIQIQPIPVKATEASKAEVERQQRRENMKSVAGSLLNVMESLVKGGQVKVTESNRGISIEINASLLFDPAQAVLNQESVQVLTAVAKVLASDTHQVQIEGHTDNLPIASPVFPSNWELSSARASSVTRLFVDNGVAPQRIVVIGYADNRPVDSNETPEGRARNRRVTVMILAENEGQTTDLSLDPDIKPSPAP